MSESWGTNQLVSQRDCDAIVSTCTGVVRKILKAMTNLRTLNLDFTTISGDPDGHQSYHVPLGDIIEPGFYWKHMVELTLGHVKAHPQELIEFIDIHKNIIMGYMGGVIGFDSLELQKSSWMSFLPQIRPIIQNGGDVFLYLKFT